VHRLQQSVNFSMPANVSGYFCSLADLGSSSVENLCSCRYFSNSKIVGNLWCHVMKIWWTKHLSNPHSSTTESTMLGEWHITGCCHCCLDMLQALAIASTVDTRCSLAWSSSYLTRDNWTLTSGDLKTKHAFIAYVIV